MYKSFLYDETKIHDRRKQGWAASLWQGSGMLGPFCTIDLMVTMEHRPATGCRLPLREEHMALTVTLFIQLKAMSGEALSSKLFATIVPAHGSVKGL